MYHVPAISNTDCFEIEFDCCYCKIIHDFRNTFPCVLDLKLQGFKLRFMDRQIDNRQFIPKKKLAAYKA